MPQYDKGAEGLKDYLIKELTPILSDCYKRDSILTASMYLILTIDRQGEVVDIYFTRIQATEKCKEELRQKIMTMKGWSSGQKGGQPVCCHYLWSIGCIKWE